MIVRDLFDAIFVNQLFRGNARGEIIFYPYGQMGRGYLVPPGEDARLRSGVRSLQIVAQLGTLALVSLLPRLIEAHLGYVMPFSWFAGGAVVAMAVIFSLIVKRLSQLTEGLAPAITAAS